MLPGRDGLEVLEAIRARLPDLPVIVLTARAAIEQRVEGLDRGANDYVTKPFSFEELLARVRAQLRHARPAQRRRCWRRARFAWICARGGSLATGARSS